MAGSASEDNPVGINVTAMVDIIFCLCLFFMCSLKFKELDGKFDTWMPKDVGVQGTPKPQVGDELRILLSRNVATGETERILGRRPIPYGKPGDELIARLLHDETVARRKLGASEVKLMVDSGASVPWSHVMDVVDMARCEPSVAVQFARD